VGNGLESGAEKSKMTTKHWMRAGVVFLALAVALWSGYFIFRSSFLVSDRRYFSLFDDAMISMRYAWNLSHGNGLVWNPGSRSRHTNC
jgi:hypothetical protein